ncbi:MAG: aldehyde dehydrogenase [Ilumatobacteraceae bacterium]|nr:aldehyde dehydrogenase [Ilumatobacteraceae bacterium]
MTFTATPLDQIAPTVARAREVFTTGATGPIAARVSTLRRLAQELRAHEARLLDALAADFGKPRHEAWFTEIGFCTAEIDHTLAHLPRWAKVQRVPTPAAYQPAASTIVAEPLGVVGVIAPWNYPVQLLVAPAIAAIAAGNTVVLKPSELAARTADALAALVADLADPAVQIVQGGVAETTELLAQRFDHIIYTGSGKVGRIVMRAAAEHLTPVTLELGGKSPAIVSRHANIDVAGRRIAWGKFVNAGQTCIAPDYVLVERPVHDELVAAIGRHVDAFYGPDPQRSPDYARIVDESHFHRLEQLMHSGTVAHGGRTDADLRYIEPTVLTGVGREEPVMAEEIFGPILPVLAVDSLAEAIDVVNAGDRPLALYTFSEDAAENAAVVAGTSSGGVCVNATLLHVANPNLPFGGVGPSGMGAYHGRSGFDSFSHRRAVHTRTTKVDPLVLYPPYTPIKQRLVRAGLRLPDPRDLMARLRASVRRR